MSKLISKFISGLNALIVALLLLLAGSLIMEHWLGLSPCVLCQLQRVILAVMLLLAGLQRFNCWGGFWSYYFSFGFFNIAGLLLAVRHIWLQSQPILDSDPIQCLPSLSVLWDWLPWHEVLVTLVKGDALCQVITWSLFGLSLVMWLGLIYLAIFVSWVVFGMAIRKSEF